MEQEKSLKKNYLYSVLYQLLLIITPIIIAPYISRKLGPEMIGLQSYFQSISTYFLLFVMLGVCNYGNRSVAQARGDREKISHLFWEIYFSQLFRALIISFIYYIFIFLFVKNNVLIATINGIYIFSAFFDISWLFFGLEEFKITVIRNVIFKIVQILFIFLLIKKPSDLWKYSLIIALVTLISNGYLWFYLSKFVDWYIPKYKEIKQHTKPVLILFVPLLAISLYKVMDRIMLGVFSTNLQVGLYTSAESVVNIPLSLITALGTVMLPRVSHLIAIGNIKKSKEYIEITMAFAMAMSFSMAFGLSAIAPTFVPVFFGEDFTACSPLIIGLSVTVIFISWANVLRTQFLIPNNRDKSFLVSIVLGAVVNLLININLIPRYSAIGAMIGTIFAEVTVCVLQTIMVRKELPIIKYFKDSIVFAIFGIIMFFIVRFVGSIINNQYTRLIVQICIGIFVYSFLILILIFTSKKNKYVLFKFEIKRIRFLFR